MQINMGDVEEIDVIKKLGKNVEDRIAEQTGIVARVGKRKTKGKNPLAVNQIR